MGILFKALVMSNREVRFHILYFSIRIDFILQYTLEYYCSCVGYDAINVPLLFIIITV